MAEEESIMMTFYAAAGSYQIRNEDGKDMPYINLQSHIWRMTHER